MVSNEGHMSERSEWFYADADGFLAATLYLTDEEASGRSDITKSLPPSRSEPGVDRVNKAREWAVAAIKERVSRAVSAPIIVGDRLIQTDSASISALVIKQATLASGDDEDLAWTDVANDEIEFQSANEMSAWISSLLSGIGARNTAVRRSGWADRSAISQLADEQAIHDFVMRGTTTETL